MSWPKPVSVNPILAPKKIHRVRWVLFFIGLFLVISVLAILSWPDKNYASKPIFWIAIVAIPTVITGIILSIRLYYYGLAQEEYEIWQYEQQNIAQNWQEWAMYSLIVLDSFYIVPNHLTAQKVRVEGENLPMLVNKSLSFGEIDYQNYFEDLFFKLQSTLNLLSDKENIDITVYSSPESYQYIDEDLGQAYRQTNIKQPYMLSHQQITQANVELLATLIDQPKANAQLIIINNVTSADTAFLCGFVLVNETKYKELAIDKPMCQILRPMITSDLSADLALMVERQSAMQAIDHCWFANMTTQQEVEVAKQLADLKISPDQKHKLQSLVGNQMDLSFWLSLALGCEMTSSTKQNNLITATSQNKWLFSVVTEVK